MFVCVVCDAACAGRTRPQVCATPAPLQGSGRQQPGQCCLTYEGEGLPGRSSHSPFTSLHCRAVNTSVMHGHTGHGDMALALCISAVCMAASCEAALGKGHSWQKQLCAYAASCMASSCMATHGNGSSVPGSIVHGNIVHGNIWQWQ